MKGPIRNSGFIARRSFSATSVGLCLRSALLALAAVGGLYAAANTVRAQGWRPATSPLQPWSSIACSTDGAKLVAAGRGLIYTSTNSGATWTTTAAPSNAWASVASSADGTRLTAVVDSPPGYLGSPPESGAIFTSTNSGATWTQANAPTNGWQAVASSADGTRLVALVGESVDRSGPVYISADSGGTWTVAGAPANVWQSVASSADERQRWFSLWASRS